jgi:hypothetical protein
MLLWCKDIAKKQGADSKELWGLVKPQIRIGLLDIEIPEDIPTYCSHMKGHAEHGAVRMRCRAPCVLGFPACPDHTGKRNGTATASGQSYLTLTAHCSIPHLILQRLRTPCGN